MTSRFDQIRETILKQYLYYCTYPESGKMLRGSDDIATQIKLTDLSEGDYVYSFNISVAHLKPSKNKHMNGKCVKKKKKKKKGK